jgi:hypothetical protein
LPVLISRYIAEHSPRRGFLVSLSLSSKPSVPDVGEMKRWAGWVVVGVLALTLGALLVIHPWSAEIPPASEYWSPWDLARDLNDHGLGCSNPTRRPSAASRRIGLPEPLVCSVAGRPVVLDVIPPDFLAAWIRAFSPRIHYTNLQDLADAFADRGSEGLRRFDIDAILAGPNWAVEARGRAGFAFGAFSNPSRDRRDVARRVLDNTVFVADERRFALTPRTSPHAPLGRH